MLKTGVKESLENSHFCGVKPYSIQRYTDELQLQEQNDWIAQEVPVALVYNGISHVVMMATPKQLEVFAVGFSLAEGIIESPQEIYAIEVKRHSVGVEVHIELATRRFVLLKQRRRAMEGRTSCGVCGVEQLAQIIKPIPLVPSEQTMSLKSVQTALSQLAEFQEIGQLTGATHVAAWILPQGEILMGCEDVGRHVALDKILGIRAKQQWQQGAILVSSRASYEMVQKSAMCGVEILIALSAATSLAIDVANQCGMTLVGFYKKNSAVIYTHPERILLS